MKRVSSTWSMTTENYWRYYSSVCLFTSMSVHVHITFQGEQKLHILWIFVTITSTIFEVCSYYFWSVLKSPSSFLSQIGAWLKSVGVLVFWRMNKNVEWGPQVMKLPTEGISYYKKILMVSSKALWSNRQGLCTVEMVPCTIPLLDKCYWPWENAGNCLGLRSDSGLKSSALDVCGERDQQQFVWLCSSCNQALHPHTTGILRP